ncbi:MAG TPA: RNA polymerase sigma factor [Candidatus Hydrogenedentes bacterium]|nr:RNA polymerase sigma factor [Candidatus Hydrogenedentota bacterium]HOJ69516.1 RNA polymerase sigma factor [Candidatus Hydrogenedentota bacterium]HOK88515.1 RNA polymerase sigma factor [Candidatus Hydrogenedentota bacterium]HOV61006.1 RNA polymerase sigma factor [Candidatus Hydrogenedentota bacterium]
MAFWKSQQRANRLPGTGQPDSFRDVPLSSLSDEELMLLFGNGRQEAFEELVRRHHKPVYGYIYRMVQNRHIAEELTQDVFLGLVQNAQRYTPTAKFTHYLYSIASRLVYREWNQRKRRPLLFSLFRGRSEDEDGDEFVDTLPDGRASIREKLERDEIVSAITEALAKIPPVYREPYILHRFQDLSYEEIVEILGCPLGTVKSRIFRAEKMLQPLLEPYRAYLREE